MKDRLTKYYQKLKSGKISCTVCPRNCELTDGQRGFCFVRQRQGNEIFLTTYGRSSGFCIDPVEKKPLNHFYPGTSILSFGTAGCNLGCVFCQNWDISKSRQMDSLMSYATPESLVATAKEHHCRAIAFTYNDPVIFLEYAIDVALLAKMQDIKTVAVTAGYINPAPREEFFGAIDGVNIDLKAFSNRFYKKLCKAEIRPVLDTLEYVVSRTSVWLEMTTLIIPGENDSTKELTEMCSWIKNYLGNNVPLHFTAFHPDYRLTDKKPTSLSILERARAIAQDVGLNYVYIGNLRSDSGATTMCKNCHYELIVRNGYEIVTYNLDSVGKCPKCQQPLDGLFNPLPGNWGNRRQVVHI